MLGGWRNCDHFLSQERAITPPTHLIHCYGPAHTLIKCSSSNALSLNNSRQNQITNMKNILLVIVVAAACSTSGCITPALKDKAIGTYERKVRSGIDRTVLTKDGIVQFYSNGKKQSREDKWKAVGEELFLEDSSGTIQVHKINADGSLVTISYITGGKRTKYPKAKQDEYTYKRIK